MATKSEKELRDEIRLLKEQKDQISVRLKTRSQRQDRPPYGQHRSEYYGGGGDGEEAGKGWEAYQGRNGKGEGGGGGGGRGYLGRGEQWGREGRGGFLSRSGSWGSGGGGSGGRGRGSYHRTGSWGGNDSSEYDDRRPARTDEGEDDRIPYRRAQIKSTVRLAGKLQEVEDEEIPELEGDAAAHDSRHMGRERMDMRRSRDEMDDMDEYEGGDDTVPKRPRISSAVIIPRRDRNREEAIAQDELHLEGEENDGLNRDGTIVHYDSDKNGTSAGVVKARIKIREQEKARAPRNRRMFGALLGHLSKAQKEESTRQDSELKRQSALKKVEERMKAFRQEIRVKEFQEMEKKKAQDRRLINTIQAKKEEKQVELLYKKWELNQVRKSEFLITKAHPAICYKPKDIVQENIDRKLEIQEDLEKWRAKALETLEEYKREIRVGFDLPEDGSLDAETMELIAEFEKEQEIRRREEEERQKDIERAQKEEEEEEAGEDDEMLERNQNTSRPTVASTVRVVGNHDFVEDFDVEKDDEDLEGIVT